MTAVAAHLVQLPARAKDRPTPTLRRARAEDASAFSAFLQGLSITSRRLRFHGNLDPQSQALALQLCQVDGVRHHAWLAWVGSGDDAMVVGEARFVVGTDGDFEPGTAELAIAVADDWQGCGVAHALMRQLLAAATHAGTRDLYGDVLTGNARMEAFMQRHGFQADLLARGDVLRMRCTPSAPQASLGCVMMRTLKALLAGLAWRADGCAWAASRFNVAPVPAE